MIMPLSLAALLNFPTILSSTRVSQLWNGKKQKIPIEAIPSSSKPWVQKPLEAFFACVTGKYLPLAPVVFCNLNVFFWFLFSDLHSKCSYTLQLKCRCFFFLNCNFLLCFEWICFLARGQLSDLHANPRLKIKLKSPLGRTRWTHFSGRQRQTSQ